MNVQKLRWERNEGNGLEWVVVVVDIDGCIWFPLFDFDSYP